MSPLTGGILYGSSSSDVMQGHETSDGDVSTYGAGHVSRRWAKLVFGGDVSIYVAGHVSKRWAKLVFGSLLKMNCFSAM